MGFRFRKSIKLFPGVRLNLSKTGISASVGRPGATINLSERGTHGTVGIPGTGISYSEKLSGGQPVESRLTDAPGQVSAAAGRSSVVKLVVWLLVALVVGIVLLR